MDKNSEHHFSDAAVILDEDLQVAVRRGDWPEIAEFLRRWANAIDAEDEL